MALLSWDAIVPEFVTLKGRQLPSNSLHFLTSMNAIRSTSPAQGSIVSNLYQVKNFKSLDSFYKFMSTGSNSLQWKALEGENLKAGYYRTRLGSNRKIEYIKVS